MEPMTTTDDYNTTDYIKNENTETTEAALGFVVPNANRILFTLKTYVPFFYVPASLIFNTLCVIVFIRQLKKKHSIYFYFLVIAAIDISIIFIYYFGDWYKRIASTDLSQFTWWCKFRDFLGFSLRNMEAWFMVAVAVERLVAVVLPHKAKVFSTRSNAIKITTTIVVGSLCLFSPTLYFTGSIQALILTSEYKALWICTAQAADPKLRPFIRKYWFWIDLSAASLIPCIIIVLADIIIVQRVLAAYAARKFHQQLSPEQLESRIKELQRIKSMIVTMLVVTLTFVTLTSPISFYHIFIGSYLAEPMGSPEYFRKQLAGEYSVMATALNYCINFYIYILTSAKFRQALKNLFLKSDTQAAHQQ